MIKLEIGTLSGTTLSGVLFSGHRARTVVIGITGIHGNFYSNPFYFNIGKTLSAANIDFIYAQTRDAIDRTESVNRISDKIEITGSFNEDFTDSNEDVQAYIDFAESQGYENIILAGHSLGANKVIRYLSMHHDVRVKKFILLSPANIRHLTSCVTTREKEIICQFRESGRGQDILPFPLLGWLNCVADTAYQWVFSDILDNVHVEKDGDFSQVEKITHSGAMIIGTFDRFTYGDPCAFLNNINAHMVTASNNILTYVENTGHTYQHKEQELADILLNIVSHWTSQKC
ncbi:alpha/beta hydrolase [Klebsiella pneumoniae]|uniref:alpha/beta hydrolase n=1 Tax=Klebsiella pneumoniae TaxID=573 RepID=UPI0007CC4B4D|nr:alpha/beta hydrolase [Klebsiella pneumoniae]SAV16641.1 Alpha/beta hydrolase family [Klebsiella pneumoniae]